MLALTDDQLATVRRLAEPLHPHDRGPYLRRVAELLRDQEPGDGLIHRVAEQAQWDFRRSPALEERQPHVGKYGRR
jgi:hypothetical protein